MAPMMRSPVKAGLVMMRARISCTMANICSSVDHALSAIPYARRACGVLPPLWSSGAMNPGCVLIVSSCSVKVSIALLIALPPWRLPSSHRARLDVPDLGRVLRDGAVAGERAGARHVEDGLL